MLSGCAGGMRTTASAAVKWSCRRIRGSVSRRAEPEGSAVELQGRNSSFMPCFSNSACNLFSNPGSASAITRTLLTAIGLFRSLRGSSHARSSCSVGRCRSGIRRTPQRSVNPSGEVFSSSGRLTAGSMRIALNLKISFQNLGLFITVFVFKRNCGQRNHFLDAGNVGTFS